MFDSIIVFSKRLHGMICVFICYYNHVESNMYPTTDDKNTNTTTMATSDGNDLVKSISIGTFVD